MKKNSKKVEPWVVFILGGREICAYTVRGTFAGELQATKEMIAYDKGVALSAIETKIVER